MNMWKKCTAALLSTTTLFSVAACADNTTSQQSQDKPLVLTTFTLLDDMTQRIAGDAVTVRSITEPGAEIHGYDPTPSDIAAASDADLILINGLGLEHWIDKLLTNSSAPRVVTSEGIQPIMIEKTTTPNPHAWMSPHLAKTYVDNITRALSDLKPDAAQNFRTNAENYKKELDKVDHELIDGLSVLPPQQRTLVSCEGAFSYLTREAHMNEGYIWPVNTEGEITPGQVRTAAEFVRKNNVPAVFCESTVEPGPYEQLQRETGAKSGGILYVDSLSPADGPVPTYLDLLTYDVNTIVKGLSQ